MTEAPLALFHVTVLNGHYGVVAFPDKNKTTYTLPFHWSSLGAHGHANHCADSLNQAVERYVQERIRLRDALEKRTEHTVAALAIARRKSSPVTAMGKHKQWGAKIAAMRPGDREETSDRLQASASRYYATKAGFKVFVTTRQIAGRKVYFVQRRA